MVVSSAGLGLKTALARTSSNCASELQTHPLVREGAQHQETHNSQTEENNLAVKFQTPRYTVSRNLTSASNRSQESLEGQKK
jgi:hypothetical protein